MLMAQTTNNFNIAYLKDSSFVTTKNCKALVLVFLSPECPLCQAYSLTLRNLFEEYNDKSIEFVGVVSGKWFKFDDIQLFQKKYKLPFQLILDTTKTLSQKYNARITPQAIVVSSLDSVLYSGRIDNWMYELGKKRKKPTETSLKNALDDILHTGKVKVPETLAIGCFIE